MHQGQQRNVLARYTNSEASTIVRSVTGLDEVEAWARHHANYSRRTSACTQSQQKDVSQVRLATDSRLVEGGSLGHMSEGREGADDDETG